MVNRPRAIGTAGETGVARFLQDNGFPHAERRALRGTLDCGDITGTPGICWEVKAGEVARNASDGQIEAWLAETETERRNANAEVGVLVVVRRGISAANAGRWWAIAPLNQLTGNSDAADFPVRMHLWSVARLLRARGFGSQLLEA